MKTLDTNKDFIEIEEIIEVIEDGTADNIAELKDIVEEVGKNADTFIKESYFYEDIIDLMRDCMEIPSALEMYIDRERLKRDMKMDYFELEIDGVEYLTLG